MTAREHVAFLSGSEHRVELLDALQTPMRPCELDDAQAASRATIQRTLTGFEERGWVVKDGRTYRLTAAGDIVRQAYSDLAAVVDTVSQTGESLSLLADLDLPASAITAATTTPATATTPHAPIERYVSHLEAADPDRLRGISPVLSEVFNDAHRGLVEAGVPMDLVIDETTFEAARERTPEAVAVAEQAPGFSLYVHPDPVGFGLTILDGHVFLGAYDDQGRCRSIIDGTNDALYEWADALYEEYRTAARVVEPA